MLFSQCSELICCFDLISASAGNNIGLLRMFDRFSGSVLVREGLKTKSFENTPLKMLHGGQLFSTDLRLQRGNRSLFTRSVRRHSPILGTW